MMNKTQQLNAVRNNGFAIQLIDNPSEEVQLEAVKQDGLAIKYIDNPSEQVQLEAVKQNGLAIKYIDNPSEQVQLEAVKQDEEAVRSLNNKNPMQSEIKNYLVKILQSNLNDPELDVVLGSQLIKENISAEKLYAFANLIEGILDFYASDEATPLFDSKEPEQNSDWLKEAPFESELPDKVDYWDAFEEDDKVEPSVEELQAIESGDDGLWELPEEDYKIEDFRDEYENLTQSQKKKLRKKQRRKEKRDRDFGFENFELTSRKDPEVIKKEEEIYYDFDTEECQNEDNDIGKLSKISFEPKSEEKPFVNRSFYAKPAFNNPPSSPFLGMPISPSRVQDLIQQKSSPWLKDAWDLEGFVD